MKIPKQLTLVLPIIILCCICAICFLSLFDWKQTFINFTRDRNTAELINKICKDIDVVEEIRNIACNEEKNFNDSIWSYTNYFEKLANNDLIVFGITKHDGMAGCDDGIYFQYKNIYLGKQYLPCASTQNFPKVTALVEDNNTIWFYISTYMQLFEIDKDKGTLDYYLLDLNIPFDKISLDLTNRSISAFSNGTLVKTFKVNSTKYKIGSEDYLEF